MSEVPPASAATILLVRDEPEFQVLMVRRHHQIDFASGALVFPGGRTHAGDAEPAWRERLSPPSAISDPLCALKIAALREAYEESGVLLARRSDGAPFAGDERADAAREAIAADRRTFLGLISELDLVLELDDLAVFARWITPAMMPKRFDTWFFLAQAPAGQLARCDGSETVDAEWIAPAEAIRLGDAGQRKVIFPTRMNLKLLGEAKDSADALVRARARRLVTVEPRLADGPNGRILVIPSDAGYGEASELLSRAV